MGRRIGVHAFARGLQDSAQERDRRAFAVGAGDMNHRWQFFLGMIERNEQALHAIERQVDAPGMQRRQTCNDGVDGSHELVANPQLSSRPARSAVTRRSRLIWRNLAYLSAIAASIPAMTDNDNSLL